MSLITNANFLNAVFADMLPGSHTIICGFSGDPNTKDRDEARRNWCGRPWRRGDAVPARFDALNSYYTVSTFEPDRETGEQRRRKSEFLQMHVVMVDDIGTKIPRASIVLNPSALIETSPGNFQGCYFLADDDDSRDRERCERLVQRMIEAGLAINSKDPGMTGVTRYARLPVGVNAKAKYIEQLGAPFRVRIVSFEPTLRYSIQEIAQAYKLDMTERRPRAPVIPITPALIARGQSRFSATLEVFQILGMYRGQHGTWHEVTCPWLDSHTERADTGAALSEPSEANGWAGGYCCHHGHCRGIRGMKDIRAWLRQLRRDVKEKRGRA
jgi:hypothetical protein